MTKHFIWIAALLLTLGACSKEEQAEPAVEESAAVETPAPEAVTEEAASNEAETATLEVVEESAAVEEPEDEPIVLAVAEDADATAREWKYKEGEHYFRLVPTSRRSVVLTRLKLPNPSCTAARTASRWSPI